MILLAVNFHYVTPEQTEPGRAIFPTSLAELERQVNVLGESFEFVERDTLTAAVAGDAGLPERACLITFDDGLRSQFELALPTLVRLGVPAVFFVPGRPFSEPRALQVHKLHHARDVLPEEEFRERLLRALERLGVEAPAVSEADATAVYRYDTPAAAEVKYLLNMALAADVRERVVDEVFATLGEPEEDFCHRTYMQPEHVRELEREHRALGSHGYSHRALGLLSAREAADDLGAAAATLERIAGARPPAVSYPYGSTGAVNRAVGEAAAELGHRFGFTMERAFNRSLADPLLLARIDVNDTPAGRAPLFGPGQDGSLEVDGMEDGRSRYLDEQAAVRRS